MNGVDIANDMDGMVNRYLEELANALQRLPASKRDQLVGEIREHISLMRADRPPVDRADMEALLNRVGLPEDIAAVALEGSDEDPDPIPAQPATLQTAPLAPIPPHPSPPMAHATGRRIPWWAIAAAAAVLVVAMLVVGWGVQHRGRGVIAVGAGRVAFALPPQPVSVAPTPLPGTSLVVPDVVGMTQAQATAVDAASGFGTNLKTIPSNTVPAGEVIAQSPKPGTVFVRNATVTLTVSSGPSA